MFGWKRLITLCYMLNRMMINYSPVQSFLKHLPKPSHENVTQTSLMKVLFLKNVWISRLKVQNIIYWSYILIIQVLWKKRACPLTKQGRSKLKDMERQAPARTLIMQFHLHLSTNRKWLADFSRYCTSHLLLLI